MTDWPYVNPGEVSLPRFARVRQELEGRRIENLPEAIEAVLRQANAAERVMPGERIAVTAGSRGITGIAEITRLVVAGLRRLGAEPFVVPAMGSHGGATAAGQLQVLASYGVTPEAVGCPIHASMDVVELGRTPFGYRVFCDRHAFEADGIVVVNRVKPHSILTGDLGSGLMKMAAIGLGKQVGADAIHVEGLARNLLPAARIVLARARIRFGIATVENAFGQTMHLEGVAPVDLEEADRHLLRAARAALPGLPFDPLDVLVVCQMGKNLSGAGLDPNVIGMHRRVGGPPEREIHTIVALDLTEASHGNAIGVGMADLITERLRSKIDRHSTYVNALTSDFLWGIKLPLAAPTDHHALALAFRPLAPDRARALVIRDTAHLDEMLVSEALIEEARSHPRLHVLDQARPLSFASSGTLHLD